MKKDQFLARAEPLRRRVFIVFLRVSARAIGSPPISGIIPQFRLSAYPLFRGKIRVHSELDFGELSRAVEESHAASNGETLRYRLRRELSRTLRVT